MALIKCRECGSEISKRADKCPECGEPRKKKTSVTTWIIVMIFFSILMAIGAEKSSTGHQTQSSKANSSISSQPTSTPRANVDYGDAHGAWAYMQLFVEKRLKSPKSADFPFGGYQHVTNLGSGRYRVKSYVDAKNALGIDIRTRFDGIIKRIDGAWQLEELTFEE